MQYQRKLVTTLQRLLEVLEHDVQATRGQLHARAWSHVNGRDRAHAHDIPVHAHAVQRHRARSRTGGLEQAICRLALVVYAQIGACGFRTGRRNARIGVANLQVALGVVVPKNRSRETQYSHQNNDCLATHDDSRQLRLNGY